MYTKKYQIDQYSSSKEHVFPDTHGCHASGTDSEPWNSLTASKTRVLKTTRAHTWNS